MSTFVRLTPAIFNSIPESARVCLFCMVDLEPNSDTTRMTCCSRYFHVDCLEPWNFRQFVLDVSKPIRCINCQRNYAYDVVGRMEILISETKHKFLNQMQEYMEVFKVAHRRNRELAMMERRPGVPLHVLDRGLVRREPVAPIDRIRDVPVPGLDRRNLPNPVVHTYRNTLDDIGNVVFFFVSGVLAIGAVLLHNIRQTRLLEADSNFAMTSFLVLTALTCCLCTFIFTCHARHSEVVGRIWDVDVTLRDVMVALCLIAAFFWGAVLVLMSLVLPRAGLEA